MRNATGIDVSREEEQFLRKAFRRFALPYVLVFAVVAGFAGTVVSSRVAPTGSPREISRLRDKVGALEKSLAVLEGRVEKVGTEVGRAGSRVVALESRKASAVDPSPDTAALERTLRDATRRVAELERRTTGGGGATAAERIDALYVRMQRIEGAVRSSTPPPVPAAPAPAPAAPGPPPAL